MPVEGAIGNIHNGYSYLECKTQEPDTCCCYCSLG